ncbi:putative disease resistance protein RGA1 isoform X1 [Lolium rigidum]|uniref:putative disease resistance protein RGA1 isoform X1 n=1 Tax=Lolium rigidum TaxID=89674 RepID=UPI001F5DD564|nr:putative disease resistance protein RGA1 isoform X1 [Lolium rigidum]XP_047087726.1 putative disease resistance protein RGA1 isoform X1 [Lolium rigidum]
MEAIVASVVVKQAIRSLAAAAGSPMARLWRNCKADLEEMRSTLSLLEAGLRDAERRSGNEEAVRVWLQLLKAVARDISGALDHPPPPSWKIFAKLSLVNKIEQLKKKLKAVDEKRHIFGFTFHNRSIIEDTDGRRETMACIDDEFSIVGRSREKQEIVRILLQSERKMTILPILGLGGMGKTTLAKLVFNDSRMQYFERRAWVHVSQNFNLARIAKAVASQFQGTADGFDDLQSLYNQLENISSGKKCLIVLDDLWESDIELLRKMKLMLNCGKQRSMVKIIVTTRIEAIAQELSTASPYKLGPLSDDNCWTVFKQIAFQSTNEEDLYVLEAVGRDIAIKCKGLPLAAHAVGSMLRNKSVDFWKATRDSTTWHKSSSHGDVLPSLRLSYEHMPFYLKPCFSYCAIFSKGRAMDKDKLIQQWIALDFVKPALPTLSHKVQAEEYLRELLATSLLQYSVSSLVTHEHAKDSKEVSMHDLVHDLARSVAGDETFYLHAINQNTSPSDNCHHIVVVTYDKRLSRSLSANVRSLHFRDCAGQQLPGDTFSLTKNVRVLDITGCVLRKLPDPIRQLAHLRYLDASLLCDKDLPMWITSLVKLHYLSIHGSSKISELPKSIGNLKDLVHLDLSCCGSLAHLPEFFSYLTNLLLLNIADCSSLSALPNSICDLVNLEILNLSGSTLEELPKGLGNLKKVRLMHLSRCSRLRVLPDSVCNLVSLEKLDLSYCSVLQELPHFFGNLQELRFLDLSHCSNLVRLPDSFGNLSKLQHLNLEAFMHYMPLHHSDLHHYFAMLFPVLCNLSNLQYLNFSACPVSFLPESLGNLKMLHTLDISRCISLRKLPQSILKLPNIKSLVVKNCFPPIEDQIKQSALDNGLMSLPKFFVCAMAGGESSNILQLEAADAEELEIKFLENVVSLEEAKKVNLACKSRLSMLFLSWTGNAVDHLVDDESLLGELLPPTSLEQLILQGYMGIRFPSWMCSATYLTNLSRIELHNLQGCTQLPSLGQLPNLQELSIRALPNIKKLDKNFCGGNQAFKRLTKFVMQDMKNLEVWYTRVLIDAEYKREEVMFPNLHKLLIHGCNKLMVKPCPPVAAEWVIEVCDIIVSSWDGKGHPNIISNSTTCLEISDCHVKPDGWRLLYHLPGLCKLKLRMCNELNSLPGSIQVLTSLRSLLVFACRSLTELPEWFGNLTSLQELEINYCPKLESLHGSMQRLTSLRLLHLGHCDNILSLPEWFSHLISLRRLEISGCQLIKSLPRSMQHHNSLRELQIRHNPELKQWCEFFLDDKEIV